MQVVQHFHCIELSYCVISVEQQHYALQVLPFKVTQNSSMVKRYLRKKLHKKIFFLEDY